MWRELGCMYTWGCAAGAPELGVYVHCNCRALEGPRRRGHQLAFYGLPSKPFKGLSPQEEILVNAAYNETKEKLKNPNIFVNKRSAQPCEGLGSGLGFGV